MNREELLANALEKIIEFDTDVSDGGKVHDHGIFAEIAIEALRLPAQSQMTDLEAAQAIAAAANECCYRSDGWEEHIAEIALKTISSLRTGVPAQQTWQPIETAPLDRSVIVATDEGIVGEAHFEGPDWYWAGGDSSDYHDTQCRYPRYWQPLPAGPAFPSTERPTPGE